MILGIGIDLMNTKRLELVYAKFEEKFAKRILSNDEFNDFKEAKNKPNFLAKRFCAKEAFLKAVGIGIGRGIHLSWITINHDELGKPGLILSKEALDFLGGHYKKDSSILRFHISMTDELPFINCFVVISTD